MVNMQDFPDFLRVFCCTFDLELNLYVFSFKFNSRPQSVLQNPGKTDYVSRAAL